MSIHLSILPTNHIYAKSQAPNELFLEAICTYVATGFFMDDDTFWKDRVCLLPAHTHEVDALGHLISSTSNFNWYHEPERRPFEVVLEEYMALLTQIVKEQVGNDQVILPLSGGLDSRSLAAVLQLLDNPVQAFSYEFEGGYPETKIARRIAQGCGFQFDAFRIGKGYLWDCIADLAQINGCYSEFTHPRQMAVLPQLKLMQGVFCLGHWGDVLFDRGVPEGTMDRDLVPLFIKKMVKPGGMVLAEKLWEVWELEGRFKDYLVGRIETALAKIAIKNTSAKARAFKTSQWAHRWTTTNLSVFAAAHPIRLPYYDDRMIDFICRVPEAYLADRRLQIAHLQQDKALAKITWQAQRPFNLSNFQYNKMPYNLPYRALNKSKRLLMGWFGQPYVQRNFELQFLGADNDVKLRQYLFDPSFYEFIPKSIIDAIYAKFTKDDYVEFSHPISMLLTLSVFNKRLTNL
ncbi:asparagine synthase C-terminal domain-containing protein [Aestuariivivens sediminis]|uniref:asparagine synthase-related protein n=1 Tax=Aestuariivivens sediminis TaxID=2913557 RepID=UPI001F5AFD18|nr:asparagine synthase C-terminal domain-containing protein [Aestuariivivens sediminis]